MKFKLSLLLVTVILLPVGCSLTKKSSHDKTFGLKILSYNVRNARGMDEVTDYDRVAAVIKRIDADCVALQELDSATQRSNGIVVLDELAKHTDMYASYNKSIDYQGGAYGVGILTRVKPLRQEAISLPGREERRSLLVVEMPDYIICSTHWSLTQEDRLASVDKINAFLEKYTQKPVFLSGDFNSVSSSEEMRKLSEKWVILNDVSQPTIPANNPTQCIDYVLATKNPRFMFRVSHTNVENEPLASDHLPVWVSIEFSKK